MKEKFITKMESGFVIFDKIIPYTLKLICLYLAIIGYLTLMFGCKAQAVQSCLKDRLYFAPQTKESHSDKNARFRSDIVYKTNRK